MLRADAWLWAQTTVKRFFLIWLSAMGLSFGAAFAGLVGENTLILGSLGWPLAWLTCAVIWNSAVGHWVIVVALIRRFSPREGGGETMS